MEVDLHTGQHGQLIQDFDNAQCIKCKHVDINLGSVFKIKSLKVFFLSIAMNGKNS